MNLYDIMRGLHILAVIAWMAGLLYLPRLYVYHLKHMAQVEMVAVFQVMERNLLRIIMNPAMIAVWLFGGTLIYIHVHDFREGWGFFFQPWFVVKQAGIIAMTGWHHYLSSSFKKMEKGQSVGSETWWRRVNEIPFALAFVMVLAVTTKCGAH